MALAVNSNPLSQRNRQRAHGSFFLAVLFRANRLCGSGRTERSEWGAGGVRIGSGQEVDYGPMVCQGLELAKAACYTVYLHASLSRKLKICILD